MIRIIVNGEERTVDEACSVRGLIERSGLSGPCAVEVNREVVPHGRHAEHVLRDGDRVEIVTLVGGG